MHIYKSFIKQTDDQSQEAFIHYLSKYSITQLYNSQCSDIKMSTHQNNCVLLKKESCFLYNVKSRKLLGGFIRTKSGNCDLVSTNIPGMFCLFISKDFHQY